MHFTFDDNSEILKAVNWGTFGLPEEPGNESAFWLGSMGAYTPCHYDSYGYNVVAQILGRKKWVLFPPEDSAFMYPSRIPYEESTVFSAVNILNPDLSVHPLFKNSHPHIVILNPGDALFVPKHWWHFVLCMDDVTVSINNWIKLDSDHESRLEESVTRALMTSLISCYEPKGESWLNLKEDLMPPDVTLDCLTAALDEWNKQTVEKFSTVIMNENNIMPKLAKTSTKCDVHCSSVNTNIHHIFKHFDFQYVKPTPFSEWLKIDTSNVSSSSELNLKTIINSFVHPDVISVICKNLKNAVNKTE
ncbi:HSPB1-associated protein 1-like isoform X1 [Stegodyphus dumicola]|uniref:HSPB1-associated protein 1-like isoform X1 n=2 Tax=Stegodyphus dumicola TaxID=202533 RepID=UPI0015AB219B|nr:HSPB1-associated protein 1-like isoform X1 [Stegodyphus dumicola]